MADVFSLTVEDCMKQFVSDGLMTKIGEVLNDEHVSCGTVHFTLAAMISEDIGNQSGNAAEAMATLMSVQQFMYQVLSRVLQMKERQHGLSKLS